MINAQVEQPKSAVDAYVLPCGYLDAEGKLHTEVHVCEITGEEEDILGAKAMTGAKKINKILSNCTTSIGPYRDNQIDFIIPELTQGDRVFLLLAIRRASLGDEMPFYTACPSCKHEMRFPIDLSELAVKKMPDPTVRTYTLDLPKSKGKLRMKVLTGKGEDVISEAAKKGKDLGSVAIFARVDSLNDRPCALDDIKTLPLIDRNFIRDSWEDHEGGVDTTIQITCKSCDLEYETELDISQSGFFNPSGTLKIWKKKYSF